MKIKNIFASVLKSLWTALGWTMIVFGGLLAGICALCALLAIFGGLETESFGEQLGLCIAFLILMCVNLCVRLAGRWLKNGTFARKQAKPAVQKASKPNHPQSTEDQRRLEAIEQNIDFVAGAIQANSVSPGKGTMERELEAMQKVKQPGYSQFTS